VILRSVRSFASCVPLLLLTGMLLPMATQAQTTADIHAIQTGLPASPYLDKSVTTSGIVIGVLSDGFYIENPDTDWDSSVATAEGIFVYTPSGVPANAVVGYDVKVTGTVQASNTSSYAGTQILMSGTLTTVSTGNSLPETVPSSALSSAATGVFGQWLEFEGMRIEVTSLLTTSGTGGTISSSSQNATSNGQFWGVLTGTSRPFRATGISELDTVPATAPSTVTRWSGNPQLLFIDSSIRGGTPLNVTANETVTNLIGIVDYHESSQGYTGILLDATSGYASVSGAATGTAAANGATGQITIATQDLDNFYDAATLGPTVYATRIAKTALAIMNYDHSPDIVAVQGAGSLRVLTGLAGQISSDGGPAYTAFWYAGNDSSGLTNGFLVDTSKIDVITMEQVGQATTYTTTSGSPATLFDRPPAVLHAGIQRTGTTDYDITVISNEMLDRTNIANAEVRAKREAQAVYLTNLVQSYQSAGEHVLAAGSYHAFEFSDGYVDTVGAILGAPVSSSLVTLASPAGLTSPNLENLTTTAAAANRYSYAESGSAEEPDHILVTSDLASITTIGYARFGADFPVVDMNDATTALRASDHDGVIAYLTIPYLTTLTLTSSLNPSYYGESVTFAATATSTTGTPTGTVTFYDGSAELGTGTLNSGSTTYSTSTLAIGSHTIKAVYGGDSSHEAATATLVQVVEEPVTTTNVLACSPNPAAFGATVTCTSTLGTASSTPTGTVTFYDGTTALGTGTLASGVATYSTSTLSVGAHTITAVYAGSGGYAASTSNAVVEVITSNFGISISPATRSVYTGETAAYTVTVTPDTGFTLDVSLTCAGLPANTTCSLTPATVTGGSGSAQLVVQTTAPAKAAAAFGFAGVLLLLLPLRKRGRWLAAIVVLGALNGCGSSGGSLTGGTPAGSYTVSVTGTAIDGSITLTHTATTSLKVKSLF
jgi:uncharacterized protein